LSDGDHPNRAGYQLLAKAVVDKLRRTGAVAAWSARH
jgi:lysophospholipase L1-like esterase